MTPTAPHPVTPVTTDPQPTYTPRPWDYLGDADNGEIEILTDPAEMVRAAQAVGVSPTQGLGPVYSDPYITVCRDPVRFPGGKLGTYIRILVAGDSFGGAGVLPLLPADPDQPEGEKHLVLLRHFRHPVRRWMWEIPRGFAETATGADPDCPESVAAFEYTAHTELDEEIGAKALSLHPVGDVHSDSGLIGGFCRFYVAPIDRIGAVAAEEGIARAQAFSEQEVMAMIRDGAITDGFTLSALTLARAHGLWG